MLGLGPAINYEQSGHGEAYGTPSPEIRLESLRPLWEVRMHGIVYLVGLIVIILALLSFFGLR